MMPMMLDYKYERGFSTFVYPKSIIRQQLSLNQTLHNPGMTQNTQCVQA